MRGILQNDQRVVIIGSGPTGLGAAYRLRELGHANFHVYDRAGNVGGLAASFTDAHGFTWDIGGHVQFSHYRYFDDLMDRALETAWLDHERESWVWIEDRFVPYPFQNNIRHLRPETRWKCLQGLIRLYREPRTGPCRNFRQWIDAHFGAGLAEVFMIPYNFKVWAHPAEEMDANWVGERVAVTDLERVLDNILHAKDDISWGPNNTFRFPARGGTGAVWERVADLIGRRSTITLNKAVAGIDPVARTVHFADGTRDGYDVLISTMPIDRLIDLAGFDRLLPVAKGLKYSTSHIIGVGLSGRPPAGAPEEVLDVLPRKQLPLLPRHSLLELFPEERARHLAPVVLDGRGLRIAAQAGE